MEGTPFGRYRLLEPLGRGGMGEVWRAHDTETNRVVAVKMLPAQLALDDVFQERFRREARAAAGLNDPHVVPIHNFGEIDGRLYVDMRLIEGQDLQGLLRESALDPSRAVTIVEHIAAALNAAHRIGLVHRDVKPSNILVTEFDFAYLIDFGIASAAGESGLTGTGTTIGTLAYMAPERFSTGQCDNRADVYALACVLYQALTGQRPYPGSDFQHLATAHLWTPAPRPTMARAGLPIGFDEVIARGMAKNPDERYQSALDLARAARAALTGAPGMSPNQAAAYTQAAVPIAHPHSGPPSSPLWRPPQPEPFHVAATQMRVATAAPPRPTRQSGRPRHLGWIFGGIAAAAVLAVVITAVVVRSTSGGDATSAASSSRPSGTTTATTPAAPVPSTANAPAVLSLGECLAVTTANSNLIKATNMADAQMAANQIYAFNPPATVRAGLDYLVSTGGMKSDDPQAGPKLNAINVWISKVCP